MREDCLSLHPPTALPWLNVSADGEDVRLVLDVSEEQHFGLSLYWNQAQGPIKPWWHSNLVRPPPPQVHSHRRLTPMLKVQVPYHRGPLKRTQPPTVKARIISGGIAARLVSLTLACSLPPTHLLQLLPFYLSHRLGHRPLP